MTSRRVCSNTDRDKTKAAEVEHAIRHYIDINIDEDPELFASFAAMLEQILQQFADNWELIYQELEKLRQKMAAKEREQTYGLDRKRQMPIFRILRAELSENHELDEDEIAQNVDLTLNTYQPDRTRSALSRLLELHPGTKPAQGRATATAALATLRRYSLTSSPSGRCWSRA